LPRKFSLYDIEALMKEAGAEKVTFDAVTSLEETIERITEKLAKKAIKYANHAGRKRVIKKSDIELLKNNLKKF